MTERSILRNIFWSVVAYSSILVNEVAGREICRVPTSSKVPTLGFCPVFCCHNTTGGAFCCQDCTLRPEGCSLMYDIDNVILVCSAIVLIILVCGVLSLIDIFCTQSKSCMGCWTRLKHKICGYEATFDLDRFSITSTTNGPIYNVPMRPSVNDAPPNYSQVMQRPRIILPTTRMLSDSAMNTPVSPPPPYQTAIFIIGLGDPPPGYESPRIIQTVL